MLAACAGPAPPPAPAPAGASWRVGRLDCVPFARRITGVALSGDSDSWWRSAAGRYGESRRPAEGALLVFRRTRHLARGHVAVVSRVLTTRQILVTHANWVHGEVSLDQPVEDVSAANDWSAVRVWWPPLGRLGETVFATYGFILPDPAPTRAAILARAPGAAAAVRE